MYTVVLVAIVLCLLFKVEWPDLVNFVTKIPYKFYQIWWRISLNLVTPLFKALNVNNSPQKSLFYSHSAKFLEEIVKRTPSITEP